MCSIAPSGSSCQVQREECVDNRHHDVRGKLCDVRGRTFRYRCRRGRGRTGVCGTAPDDPGEVPAPGHRECRPSAAAAGDRSTTGRANGSSPRRGRRREAAASPVAQGTSRCPDAEGARLDPGTETASPVRPPSSGPRCRRLRRWCTPASEIGACTRSQRTTPAAASPNCCSRCRLGLCHTADRRRWRRAHLGCGWVSYMRAATRSAAAALMIAAAQTAAWSPIRSAMMPPRMAPTA